MEEINVLWFKQYLFESSGFVSVCEIQQKYAGDKVYMSDGP